jgi:hypothetical protein
LIDFPPEPLVQHEVCVLLINSKVALAPVSHNNRVRRHIRKSKTRSIANSVHSQKYKSKMNTNSLGITPKMRRLLQPPPGKPAREKGTLRKSGLAGPLLGYGAFF